MEIKSSITNALKKCSLELDSLDEIAQTILDELKFDRYYVLHERELLELQSHFNQMTGWK